MTPNFLVLGLSTLIPLFIGFIWYHPKVFGNVWMKAADMTEDKIKGANMAVIFGLTLVLGFFLAMSIYFMVIHQAHIFSAVMGDPALEDPNSALSLMLKDFMDLYGNNYRSFKHGALHGAIGGVMIALPVLAVNALFERKGATYIGINAGYWITVMTLMGGVICAYG